MQFLVVLILTFLIGLALPARFGGRSVPDAARRALGIAFVFAGLSHFVMPDMFRAHFPSWTPAKDVLVYASGAIEIVGGIALFVRRYQAQVGLALAAYLVLVFPANVYVAVYGVDVPGLPEAWWYAWVRLPLQMLFIWWAVRSTNPTTRTSRSIGRLTTAAARR